MHNRIILLILLVFFFIIIGLVLIHFVYESSADPYSTMSKSDYAKALGLSTINCSYSDFIMTHEIEEENQFVADNGSNGIVVQHNDIEYFFLQDDTTNNNQKIKYNDYYLVEIIIRNPSIRFGKHRIGVGSSRKEIENEYSKNETCYKTENLGSGYIDGNWLYIRFLYDNERVVQMSISQE